MHLRATILLSMFLLCCSPALQAEDKPVDRAALAGLKSARVIFDVRVTDVEKLVFNLHLIDETFAGIEKQGVKPNMIVAFRGPGVRLLSAAALDEEAVELFRTLKKKGVRFEACGVAMRLFKADPQSLIPEVTLVSNVFNSLIGYQNQGYAMIAIN